MAFPSPATALHRSPDGIDQPRASFFRFSTNVFEICLLDHGWSTRVFCERISYRPCSRKLCMQAQLNGHKCICKLTPLQYKYQATIHSFRSSDSEGVINITRETLPNFPDHEPSGLSTSRRNVTVCDKIIDESRRHPRSKEMMSVIIIIIILDHEPSLSKGWSVNSHWSFLSLYLFHHPRLCRPSLILSCSRRYYPSRR